MIRAFLAALLVAIGVGGPSPAPVSQAGPGQIPKSVLGILWNETGLAKPRLAHLKPLTLEPTGRVVRLRLGGGSATAVSPNGRLLAVGTAAPGIQLIDLRRMREVGHVKLGGTGWVTHLSWQRGPLFAAVQGDTNSAVFVVDPGRRQVIQQHRISRAILAVEDVVGGIVAVTGPRSRVGPVELTVVRRKGMSSVSVAGVVGGAESENESDGFHARQVTPGLAVDRTGKRAFIVPAGKTIAEISLNNLAVEYHSVAEPVSLLSRLHNWLEPSAEAKLIEGPQRKAAWLGNGVVAVTGADYSTETGTNGEPHVHVRAAGLSLVDTENWSSRTIDEEKSDFSVVGSRLLAFGDTSWGDAAAKGTGLTGYDFDGRELFHVMKGRKVGWVENAGDLAYVVVNDRRRVVVDAVSGRVLARATLSHPLSVVTYAVQGEGGSA
jgi:hypothetical protein